ncbi:MAG: peptidyl-prolyl cis-trans isomerase [Alphaproteobacteria bacterium]
MLDTLRRSASSWVAKFFFALLVLSFGVWGIEDFVRGGTDRVAAIQVGDITFHPRAVREEFNRDVSRLRAMLGPQLTAEEAQRMGLMNQTVQRLVSQATIDMASRELGVVAPDAVVRGAVERRKEFLNAEGRFDRDRFRQILAANGYTEEGYLHLLRRDIIRRQLIEPVSLGAAPPRDLVDTLYRHRQEKRVADAVTVLASAMPAPPAPDQAALEAYHGAHAETFTAPEYRAVTALLVTPATVASLVTLTEEMVAEAYASHQDDYRTPERRDVAQVLLTSREQADKVLALVGQGRPLKDAATTAGAGSGVQELGWVARADLPDELADAVFALKTGETSQPVQSPLGWHLFRVAGSQPEVVKPLAEVRKAIEEELAKEKAVDLVYKLSNQVEDALAGGASLDDAARTLNLKSLKVAATDRSGKAPDGKPVAGLPKLKEFLPTVFSLQEGRDGQLVESDDGYFVARVDGVTPSRLRPLDEVRTQVIDGWTKAQRDDAARRKAESILGELRAGKGAWTVAIGNGVSLSTTPPLPRTGDLSGKLPVALVSQLFQLKTGEVAMAPGPDGYLVIRLAEVIPADPADDAVGVTAVSNEIRASMADDLAAEFTAALGRKYKVSVNRRVLEE